MATGKLRYAARLPFNWEGEAIAPGDLLPEKEDEQTLRYLIRLRHVVPAVDDGDEEPPRPRQVRKESKDAR